MSKFFVQMLLSIMVGAGAALGFSPQVRSGLHETLQETKDFLRETAGTIVENVHDLATEVDASISVQTSTDVSADENGGTAELDVNSGVNVKNDSGISFFNRWFPDLSLNSFFSNETQTDIATDGADLDAGLQEQVNSTLDLGLK